MASLKVLWFPSGALVAGGLKYQASETQKIFPCYNV